MKEKVVPAFDLGALRSVRSSELGIRFAFGFVISVVAGLLSMRFGPRFGGMFLAFPAILPASLTLIEQKQHSGRVAGINATGAVLGSLALLGFALAAIWALPRLALGFSLLVAALAWLVVAVVLYFVAAQIRPLDHLIRSRSEQ